MVCLYTCCPGRNFPIESDSLPAPKVASLPLQVKPSSRQFAAFGFLVDSHKGSLRHMVTLFNSP